MVENGISMAGPLLPLPTNNDYQITAFDDWFLIIILSVHKIFCMFSDQNVYKYLQKPILTDYTYMIYFTS